MLLLLSNPPIGLRFALEAGIFAGERIVPLSVV
jgi:hypothetical protein